MYSSSYKLSYGTKKYLYHFFFALITIGKSPSILFTCPSRPSSPKNKPSSINLLWMFPYIVQNMATAIGKSKLVPFFLISDGDKLSTNFTFGILIQSVRSADFILSLDSFMIVSGSHIISIPGRDLLVPASIMISYHTSHMFVKVFILWIMLIHLIWSFCMTDIYMIWFDVVITTSYHI